MIARAYPWPLFAIYHEWHITGELVGPHEIDSATVAVRIPDWTHPDEITPINYAIALDELHAQEAQGE